MRVFVGLGSNVGDRLKNLEDAVAALRAADGVEMIATSSVYETVAIGPPQADFLNAVVEIETDIPADALLRCFRSIEAAAGRVRKKRWGPREIDLDLLVYGEQLIDSDQLRVPHPQVGNRAFVLVPLLELAPDLIIPGLGPAPALLERLDRSRVRPFDGSL